MFWTFWVFTKKLVLPIPGIDFVMLRYVFTCIFNQINALLISNNNLPTVPMVGFKQKGQFVQCFLLQHLVGNVHQESKTRLIIWSVSWVVVVHSVLPHRWPRSVPITVLWWIASLMAGVMWDAREHIILWSLWPLFQSERRAAVANPGQT